MEELIREFFFEKFGYEENALIEEFAELLDEHVCQAQIYSYDQGYDDGHESGYNRGYSDGHEDGCLNTN